MNCPNCKPRGYTQELIWGGDHTFEDYDHSGEGIVSNLSCPKCETFLLIYVPDEKNPQKD